MVNQDNETNQSVANQGPAAEQRKPGHLGRTLRWTAIALFGSMAAVSLAAAIFVALGVPIDLSWLRDRIEVAASDALNRSATIEGPIKLVPTVWPTVQIEGIRVGNPDGWPETDFVQLKLARAQLSVLAILSGDVRIEEITIDGLRVSLVTNAEGEPNWVFENAAETARPEAKEVAPALRFIELRELSLTDIAVIYRDTAIEKTYELRINQITGNAEDEQPLQLFIQGSVQRVPYAVTLTGGSLAALVDGETPWPLDVSAVAVGTNLAITGEIAEPLRGKGLALDFALKGPTTDELEVILGVDLPPIRSFDLTGRVEEAGGAYRIANLQGTLAGIVFTGDLEVDTSGPLPRLRGAIDVASIDVRPLAAAIDAEQKARSEADSQSGPDEENRQPVAEGITEGDEGINIDEPILTLDPLKTFDAEFTLTIHEVVGSSVAVSDASLKVSVEDGKLTGPLSVSVAEVPLTGKIGLVPQEGKPAVSVSLSAQKSDIGELLALLVRAEGVEGSFETAELEVSARGETIRSLVGTTNLRFAIAGAALSYGHEVEERPVEFSLDMLEMVFPATSDSRIAATGELLGEPFSLELSGGTFLENYIEQKWPFDLTATGGGAQLRLTGAVGGAEHDTGAGLEFSVAGEHIGGLSRWIGVSPGAKAPYALSGAFMLGDAEIGARIDQARIGDTTFGGELGIKHQDDKPVTYLKLAFGVIDVAKLAALLPEKQDAATPDPSEEAFTIDVPILPKSVEFVDSDIEVTVERIKIRPSDITEISLSAQIRNGYAEKTPVRAVVAGAALEGNLSTDLRGDVPKFDLNLQSTKLDVGALLALLGVATGLDVTAGQFDLRLAMRGASVRAILEQSMFSAGIRDGLWRLRDPNTNGSLDIGIREGTIEAPVAKPIALVVDGHIDRTPVKIAIRTDSLASFAKPKNSLDASLKVELLNAVLELTGSVPLPVQAGNMHFTMDFGGERISDFDELLGVSLPPYGPYNLGGEFGIRTSGYYIKNLRVGVGSSTLTGALDLDTTQSPPRLNVNLVARTVQLDDFDSGEWSVTEGVRDTMETTEVNANSDGDVLGLLSPQVMRRLESSITVDVEEVLSGQDRLGKGTVVAKLNDGRLTIDPLSLSVPGGDVDVGFALEPTESDVGLEVRAKIEQLDYGLLARRIDPDATTGGLISVDIDVTARGRTLSDVMAGSNGHIGFAVWPKDLDAGVFDLWAVNLFTASLSSLDSEASNVNCLVAWFELNDGIMRPTALLIDTARIQASGDGMIDFKKNTVEFQASPKSKKPQMFSAQTPIEVKGRFSEFEVGLAPDALAETIVRVITSPLVVPFQWVFTENEPSDGKYACQTAWGQAPRR